MQPKIFLTGATGYIGSAIAKALQRAGYDVSGLARSDEAAARLTAQGITPLRGDLNDPRHLAHAAAESEGVIHAGTTNNGRIDQDAVVAMANSLRATLKPFIYTSGIWVLGDTGGKVADETWPLNPIPLVAWRPDVENMVIAAGRLDVRSIVIRPAVVYGYGKGLAAEFAKSARETGAARYVGSGENHWPMVHADDLADLYVRALRGAVSGTILFAADESTFRVREIAEAASVGAGAGGRTESWPIEEARKVIGGFADALALDQIVSSAKARTMLGWKPSAPSVLDDLRQGSYVR